MMFPYKSLLVVMTVLALAWLIQGSTASAIRPYRTHAGEKTRQEIISLASKIIKRSMYGFDWDDVSKRNGGTGDTLYNLPDLGEIGRRPCEECTSASPVS